MPPLRGDPSRLRQVLFNLVGNAVKFTEEGGVRVEVAHAPVGDARVAVAIAVRDTGVGISAEQRERLFERFSRLPSAIRRGLPGIGLGLAMVYGTVKQIKFHTLGAVLQPEGSDWAAAAKMGGRKPRAAPAKAETKAEPKTEKPAVPMTQASRAPLPPSPAT